MSDLTPEKLAELRRDAERCASDPNFPHDGLGRLVRALPALLDAAAERDEITGESAGVGAIPADVARCVRLWAERFRTGDVWDIEDARDLEFALNGTVASAEVVRSRRRHFARVAAVLDWSSVTRYGEADADELLARLDEIDARSTRA